MRDEIDGRLWVDHGHLVTEQMADFIDRLGRGFARLQQIQFAAPWRKQPRAGA